MDQSQSEPRNALTITKPWQRPIGLNFNEQWWRVPSTERDWESDFKHENGCYQCKCYSCYQMFFGHKRRVECYLCATSTELFNDGSGI